MNHFNIDVDSPASASSSTLIFTPLDTKNDSHLIFNSPNATHVLRTPKPKLNLITTTSTSPPPTRMSGKGFIEPHRSHLPRRTRAKTAPNSTSSAGKTKNQTDPSTTGGNPPLSLDVHPTRQQQQGQPPASDLTSAERLPRASDVAPTKKLSVSTKMTMSSKGFIEPHRSHLPRRAKTSPNQTGMTRSKRVPLPLPVDSPLSLVQPETTVETELELPSEPIIPVPALHPFPTQVPLSLPTATTTSIGTPPPPPFSATAAALISIAQNKMIMADSNRDRDDEECLSPVLPHPAMGLTMGLMEAAREAAEGASFAYGGTPIQTPQKTPVPTTLNPSPALGVFGSPTPSRTPVPVSSVGLLGNNLPRRHKRGRETNLRKASLKKDVVEEEESDGRGKDGESEGKVLRLVGVRRRGDEDDDGISSLLAPSHSESYSRRGGHRAGSAPAHESSRTRPIRRDTSSERRCMQVLGRSRVEVGFWLDDLKDYVLLKTVDSLSSDSDSDNDDDSCLKLPLLGGKAAYKDGIPTLTNPQIHDGCEFMRKWIGKSSLLLPSVKTDCGDTSLMIRILTPRWRPEEAMGLALCYLARAEMEAPRSESEKGAAHLIVQEDSLSHPRVVPFGVNDLDLSSLELPSSETNLDVDTEADVFSMELPSREDVIAAANDCPPPDAHYAYSSIHHLSMRLLDDDLGEWMGRRAMDEVGGTKNGRFAAVGLGLGILGSQAIREGLQVEGRSDSDTAGSSRQGRPTHPRRKKRGRTLFRYPPRSLLDNDKGKEKGLHVREAAFGGREGSLSISETCEGSDVQRASSVGNGIGSEWEKEKQRDWKARRTWTGMRDEWRGVLSFEGLEGLVGIWPQ